MGFFINSKVYKNKTVKKSKLHHIVIVLMTLLCVVNTFALLRHSSKIVEAKYFKIVISLFGMLLSETLSIVCFVSNDKTKQKSIINIVSIILFTNIFLSGIIDLISGVEEYRVLNFTIITIVCVNEMLLFLLFWIYQCVTFPKDKLQKGFTIWFLVLISFYLILLVLNPWLRIIYHINSDGVVVYSGELIELFLFIIVYLSYIAYIIPQKVSLKKKNAIASFSFFPITYIIIEFVWYFYGIKYNFFSGYYIFLLFALYVVFLGDYVASKDQLLKQRAEIAEDERKQIELQTTLMLSQMRPHFVFNVITGIRNLCKTNPKEAYNSLGFFASYLRANMDSLGEGKIIPFSKELEHIKAYVSLEEMRFRDELKVEYHVDFQDFDLPALTVQPIVENAIKYGATLNENGGLVIISTYKEGNNIYITICDNGPGFNVDERHSSGKTHLGISNVSNCLKATGYGELLIKSEKGKGTIVTIVLKGKL